MRLRFFIIITKVDAVTVFLLAAMSYPLWWLWVIAFG